MHTLIGLMKSKLAQDIRDDIHQKKLRLRELSLQQRGSDASILGSKLGAEGLEIGKSGEKVLEIPIALPMQGPKPHIYEG